MCCGRRADLERGKGGTPRTTEQEESKVSSKDARWSTWRPTLSLRKHRRPRDLVVSGSCWPVGIWLAAGAEHHLQVREPRLPGPTLTWLPFICRKVKAIYARVSALTSIPGDLAYNFYRAFYMKSCLDGSPSRRVDRHLPMPCAESIPIFSTLDPRNSCNTASLAGYRTWWLPDANYTHLHLQNSVQSAGSISQK